MGRLFLVRHGPSLPRSGVGPHEWELDPAQLGAVDELRRSGRLPEPARWFSSPEPKALGTARRLTDAEVVAVDELREHHRGPTPWFDDPAEWRAVVRRVFTHPEQSAMPGWEPLAATRSRLVPAVRRLLAAHPAQDLVLVGHGTAWTLLVSELTGAPPDLEAWQALAMPDVWVVPA